MNEVALNCSFFATDKIVADDLEKFFIQIIKELMIYRVFVLFFFSSITNIVRVLCVCRTQSVFKRYFNRFLLIFSAGPAFWGLINPEWSLCNKGRRQSPVNLEPQRLLFDPNLRPLHIDKHRVSALSSFGIFIRTRNLCPIKLRFDSDLIYSIRIVYHMLCIKF